MDAVLVLNRLIAPMLGGGLDGLDLVRGWDDPEAALAGPGRNARVLVAGGIEPMGPAFLDRLPNLGLIACLGSGFDGVDLDAVRARGIAVTNAAGANAPDVADLAVTMLLALLCGLPRAHAHVREDRWRSEGRLPLRPSLHGRRVGIVGLGAIGLASAERLAPFGVDIRWWGPRLKPDCPYPRAGSLLELARDSDALIVCNRPEPGPPLVDAPVIDALGPGGMLVNVSRGQVVDEDALHAALVEGRLAGAGLDVFAPEPTAGDRWAGVPNVILAPHIGGATIESLANQVKLARRNIDLFLAGQPLATPVLDPRRDPVSV